MTNVVLADSDDACRARLRDVLVRGCFTVAAEAVSAPAAVEASLRFAPRLVLLEVDLPGDGIVAARCIIQQAPASGVVMLDAAPDPSRLLAALHAGATGYLRKDMHLDRLPNALRAVVAGEAAVPRSLVTVLVKELRNRDRRLVPRREGVLGRLTAREWQVLELMADGLSTHAIAAALYVEPVTVRTHVGAVLKKLRVPDRDAAVRILRQR